MRLPQLPHAMPVSLLIVIGTACMGVEEADERPAHDQRYLVECNSTTIGAACDSDDTLCTRETCQMDGADVVCVFTANEPDATSCESDGDPCTADRCSAGGCVAAPLPAGTLCNDGDACTTGETCDAEGSCAGGDDVICPDDGDPCSEETCEPGIGCSHTPAPSATPCDDGLFCTVGDACDPAGACVGRPNCRDGNPCTADACDEAADACPATVLDGAACDGDNTCRSGGTCDASGACVGDIMADGEACDDGDECTGADACLDGACASEPIVCDDGDPCTTDDCAPSTGCRFTPLPGCDADAGPPVVPADAAPYVSGDHDAGPGDGDANDDDPAFAGDLGGGGCQAARGGAGATGGLLGGLLAALAIVLAVRRRRASLLAFAAGLAALLAAGPARAQGLDAQIFQPAMSSSGYLTQDGAHVLPAGRFDLGLSLDFAQDLLVMRDPVTGAPLMDGALVSDRLTLHLTGGVGLFGFLELGADLPVSAAQAGDLDMVRPTDGAAPALRGTAPGDLRLAAKAHVLGAGLVHLAVVAGLSMPTGSAEGFSGNETAVFSPKLVLGVNARAWSLALNAGYRLRGRSQVANLVVDDELVAGLAAGFQVLPARLWLVGEAYAAIGVQGDGAGRERPAEVDLGARLAVTGPWALTGGVGFGVGNGYGAPRLRAILGISWAPRPRPGARSVRALVWTPPDEAEDDEGEDADVEAERDTDALVDQLDLDDEERARGEDGDRDGIIDLGDTCPEEAETMNGKDDDDGCPDRLDAETPVRIVAWKNRLKTLPAVRFELGKAPLRLESHAVLDALADYLTDHPEIERLRIEVHTDDRSNAARSVLRSRSRAEHVRRYLEMRGIAAERLESAGFGPYRPVAPNDTAQHRNWNRRVDFIIVRHSPARR